MGCLKGAVCAVLLVLTAVLVLSPVNAHDRQSEQSIDAKAAWAFSQDAIGRKVGGHVLTDHRGNPLPTASFRGRPLVVSLVFTSCSSICPVTTDHLRNAVIEARRALGDSSFNVLTFGFDSAGDKPGRLAAFAGLHQLREIAGWQVASADAETTHAFLDELGFTYRVIAGGFDHVTQTTILDDEGRVYRQVYGDTFPMPVFMEPLKNLVFGVSTRSLAPADLWDRIAFLCTVYNPLTGAYRFDYSILFGVSIGGLSLLLTGIWVLRLWLGNRHAGRSGAKPATR